MQTTILYKWKENCNKRIKEIQEDIKKSKTIKEQVELRIELARETSAFTDYSLRILEYEEELKKQNE